MSIAHVIKGGLALAGTIMQGVAALKQATNTDGAAQATRAAAQSTQSGTVNKDNFLDLLISQITHQNPLEPMDNETMVTQMTQMQTLEKIEELNEKVGSMMVYQNLMNSVDLIGKQVSVVDVDSASTITGKVEGIRIQNGFPGVVVNGKFYDVTQISGVL